MPTSSRSPISSLQPFVDRGGLAGAVVLVASPSEVLSLEAIGWADIAAKKPMRTDQTFWIASMTKPIMATLVMTLVDEGKINLDDPVEKYLPEFKGQMVEVEKTESRVVLEPVKTPMTVADTLRHTSGLTFLSRLEPKIDILNLRETVYVASMTNLMHQPGTKYAYSNCGTNTAARVAEVVSGVPFERLLDERFIKPLGMHDTTFWPNDEQVARLAKTYKGTKESLTLQEVEISQCRYPLQNRARTAHPGGGLFSTAIDVSQFGQMILSGGTLHGRRYVSQESVRKMTSVQTGDLTYPGQIPGGGYGFCWTTNLHDGVCDHTTPPCKFGHGGALATGLWIYPEHHLSIVYLVQHSGYGGTDGDDIYPALEKAALAMFGK